MAKRGRPTKFDDVLLDRLSWLLAHGWDRAAAAEDVGIGRATFYRWLDDPRPEFDAVREAVARSEVAARAAVEMNIVRRSETDWRAGYAWLRTRYPEDWGRPPRRRQRRLSRQKRRN